VTTLAITGGTGFVGAHLLRVAGDFGVRVRALTRRPQPAQAHVDWVSGHLANPGDLCRGVDAVIHIAGVINARTPAEFAAGNVDGTRTMLAAAREAGVRRFIHISSLAAREPALSAYGASKAKSEAVVTESELDWTIVRPPMVYGPGDRETLAIFRMVRSGVAALPARGRFSMIHADDLARALVALVDAPAAHGLTLEPDDGVDRAHAELAALIGEALGRRPVVLPLPRALLTAGAAVDTLIGRAAGKLPKLSFDRARYLAHPDWTSRRAAMLALGIWQPTIDARRGLAETAAWYRAQRWL
jgi:nucleoside-diphosphate-sugar epimerase